LTPLPASAKLKPWTGSTTEAKTLLTPAHGGGPDTILRQAGDTGRIGEVVERILAILEKEVDKELRRSFGFTCS
jgi:hypothetical protein